MEDNLNNIGKRLPYEVPEGFFDTMHGRILAQTARKSRPFLAVRWIAAAAVVAIVASTAFFVLRHTNQTGISTEKTALAESAEQYFTDEEIESWVAFYDDDMFLTELSEY